MMEEILIRTFVAPLFMEAREDEVVERIQLPLPMCLINPTPRVSRNMEKRISDIRLFPVSPQGEYDEQKGTESLLESPSPEHSGPPTTTAYIEQGETEQEITTPITPELVPTPTPTTTYSLDIRYDGRSSAYPNKQCIKGVYPIKYSTFLRKIMKKTGVPEGAKFDIYYVIDYIPYRLTNPAFQLSAHSINDIRIIPSGEHLLIKRPTPPRVKRKYKKRLISPISSTPIQYHKISKLPKLLCDQEATNSL